MKLYTLIPDNLHNNLIDTRAILQIWSYDNHMDVPGIVLTDHPRMDNT